MARPSSRITTLSYLFISLCLFSLSALSLSSASAPPPPCYQRLLDFEASALSGRARPFLLADDECGRSARALLPPAALAACLRDAHAGPAVRRRRFFDAVGEAAQRLLAHGERARDLGSGDESFVRTKTLVGAAWLLLRGSEGPVSLVATERARRRDNARRTAAVVVAGHIMARLALAEGDYDGAERTMRDAAAAGGGACAMRRRRQSRSGRGAAGRGRGGGSGEGEKGGDRGGGDDGDDETGSAASEGVHVGGGKTTGDEGSAPQEIIRIIRETCLHLNNDLLLLRRDYTGAFAHLRRWHARRRGVGGSGRRRRSRSRSRSSSRGSMGDGGGDIDTGEERADRQQQQQQQQQEEEEEEAEVEWGAEDGDGRRAHNENSDDLVSLNKLEHDVDQFNHLLSGMQARDLSATGQARGRGGAVGVGGAAVEHRLSAAVGAYGQLAAHIRSHPALQGLLRQGTAAKLSDLLATIGHDDNASTTALGNVSAGTGTIQDTVGFSPVVATRPAVSESAEASAAAASNSAGASVSAAASASAAAAAPSSAAPSRPSQGRLHDTKATKAIVHSLFNAAIHIPLPPTRPFRGRALGATVATAGEEARLAASMKGPSRVAVVDNFLR